MKEFGKLTMWAFNISEYDITNSGEVVANTFKIEWDFYNEILTTQILIDDCGDLIIAETLGDTVLIDGLESEVYDYQDEISEEIKRLFKEKHNNCIIGDVDSNPLLK